MGLLVSLICGIVFGVGVTVSGMTNPAQVLAFFDIFGSWDPTLGYVMAGALSVTVLGYAGARRRNKSILGGTFPSHPTSLKDVKLFLGAALFGVGWGLVGFCPGPVLASLGRGSAEVLIFSGSMVAGMLVWRLLATFLPKRS